MHTTAAKGFLPSPRMYATPVGAGMVSPTLPPHPATSLPMLKSGQPSPHFRDAGDSGATNNMTSNFAQAYNRASQSESVKLQTAASLVYAARMRQEAFPYGISGVPAVSGYGYSSELYSYAATNGFPRKSRICSYCSKVFTRSTTRRYHEKRCPLLRAAGSLMKGTPKTSPTCNGFSREHPEPSMGGIPSQPPMLSVVTDSSSLPASKSTSVNTSPTSQGLVPMSRAPTLNSQLYSMYGSQQHHPTISTSTQSPTDLPHSVGRPTILDHNQNSIVKPEHGMETGSYAKNEHDEKNFLLRSKPQPPHVEESNQGQMMFSHLSPRSKSDEEDPESEDGDQMMKNSSENTPEEDENYIRQLALKRYKLAQLIALQRTSGMTHPANLFHLRNPCVTSLPPSSEKLPREAGADAEESLSPQKEDPSLTENDASLQDDDNTETYYLTPPNMESEDLEEEDDEEEEEEEEKKCGICSEEFEEKESLQVHQRVHQKYKPNTCRYCGHRFPKVSMRIAHQRTHMGRYTMGCVVCGMHVLTKFGLRQHMHREHYNLSVGETECRYCHIVIDNVYEMREHFNTHRQQIALTERQSIRFLRNPIPPLVVASLEEDPSNELPPASVESKVSHDSPTDIESGPPPLIGPIMPATAANEQGIYRANGAVPLGRSREKDWCRICEKEIPKSAMRYHEREHADQKPYECPLCKKRFGYKNNMKSHMKLHAGIKPYQCQVCGAKFTRGSTLRRHARRHGINNDTIWDFFVRKNAASRTPVFNTGMSHSVPATPEHQGQGQVSPMNQEMKPDDARAVILKKPESNLEKVCHPAGISPNSSIPQTLLNPSYPAVAQPMLQPCMTPQQYLRYATGFTSAAAPPPPQAMEADEALDFSMPDKQRRRSCSSSSSVSSQRCPSTSSLGQPAGYPMSAAMERSPSALSQTQPPHGQPLSTMMDRRRSMGSYPEDREMHEERRRNTISLHGAYHQFNKHYLNGVGMSGSLERPMEGSLAGHRAMEGSHGGHRAIEVNNSNLRGMDGHGTSHKHMEFNNVSHRGMETHNAGHRPMDANNLGHRGMEANNLGHRGMENNNLSHRGIETSNVGHRSMEANNLGHRGMEANNLGHRGMDANNLGHRKMDVNNLGHRGLENNNLGHRSMENNNLGHRGMENNNLGHRGMENNNLGHRPMEANTAGHSPMHKPNCRDVSTQDAICCPSLAGQTKDAYRQRQALAGCNPVDMSVPRLSGKSSWNNNPGEESLESLTSSGRLFHCRPCDCYYTDLTMFRIHRKIHIPDMPYVCFLCHKDCHDKINFSTHMLSHLR